MKRIIVMLLLILSINFVAAYGFGDSHRTKFGGEFDYKFNNNDRSAEQTFNSWGKRVEKFGFDNERRFGGKESGANYYYKYVSHMRSWKKVTCYNTPPADRIFYIKCRN